MQLQQIMLGRAEGGVCLATCRFSLARSVESISKAASLFERHLNIDSLSLFESEGTNQSLVPAEHSLANSGKSDVAMTRRSFTR